MSLEQTRLLIPSYTLSPGGPLAPVPQLEGRIRGFLVPSASKTNINALAALQGYWAGIGIKKYERIF